MNLKQYIKSKTFLYKTIKPFVLLIRGLIQIFIMIKQNYFLQKRFKKFNGGKKRILLLLTPEYGNIGDNLIAMGEYHFFQERFADYQIDEVSMNMVNLWSGPVLKKYKRNYENIVISGGGFLGTLWPKFEKISQVAIKALKDKNIIIFPQTIFYEKESKLLWEVLKLYRDCNKLSIYIRDKSYFWLREKIKEFENVHVFNVPDIAMYLNYSDIAKERSGVILCLRKDKERIIDNSIQITIDSLSKKYKINISDTVLNCNVKLEDREKVCLKKINEFQTSSLVITDRLHGMLLCLITGTPCIAFNNISNKVKGVYELWLKDVDYIRLIEAVNELSETLVDIMIQKKVSCYKPSQFEKYWAQIESSFV